MSNHNLAKTKYCTSYFDTPQLTLQTLHNELTMPSLDSYWNISARDIITMYTSAHVYFTLTEKAQQALAADVPCYMTAP